MCLQKNLNHFWRRVRDDVFLMWKKGDAELNRQMGSDDLDRFLWKLQKNLQIKQLLKFFLFC